MRKHSSFFQYLIILIAFSCSFTAMATPQGMWRWYDENGNPQFSDTPPQGIDAEFIKSNAVGRVKHGSQPAPSSVVNTDSRNKENPAPLSKDSKLEIVTQKDPALCKQAQENLSSLTAAPRIRVTEADGSQRLLSGDEVEMERGRSQKFIDIYCP